MLAKDKYSLESIIESINRILEYTSGLKSADELNADYRNFDATMMNFVVNSRQTFKRLFEELTILKILEVLKGGLRNLVLKNTALINISTSAC